MIWQWSFKGWYLSYFWYNLTFCYLILFQMKSPWHCITVPCDFHVRYVSKKWIIRNRVQMPKIKHNWVLVVPIWARESLVLKWVQLKLNCALSGHLSMVRNNLFLFFYRLSDATLYDHINTICQFVKPFLDKNCRFLRNMEPLKYYRRNVA